MITAQQENMIKEITGKFKSVLVGIFGSYARNEHPEHSELDVLIDFDSNINFLDLMGLEQELSESLGLKVDLVTVKSVHKRLAAYIHKDLIRII